MSKIPDLTVRDRLRELEAERGRLMAEAESLRHEVANERLSAAQAAVDEVNALGFDYPCSAVSVIAMDPRGLSPQSPAPSADF